MDEEGVVELSPVGRTGTTPVTVAVVSLVMTAVVDEVAIHDEEEAQAYPFPQHPPPILMGQGWEFVEHASVVWRPVYVLVDIVVLTIRVEDAWVEACVEVVTVVATVEFRTPARRLASHPFELRSKKTYSQLQHKNNWVYSIRHLYTIHYSDCPDKQYWETRNLRSFLHNYYHSDNTQQDLIPYPESESTSHSLRNSYSGIQSSRKTKCQLGN